MTSPQPTSQRLGTNTAATTGLPATPDAFVRGTVSMKPELAAKVPANGTLFIFAKSNKIGAPIAAHRQPVGTFPVDFKLTSADVMMGGMVPTGKFFVIARVIASGNSTNDWDLEGATPDSVPVGTEDVSVAIDTVVGGLTSAEDHYTAGKAHAQVGDLATAVPEFHEAARLAPNSAKYGLALATAYYNQKEYPEATEVLQHLLGLDPNNGQAHRLMGSIDEITGETARACGEFAEFLRILPKSSQVPDTQARMNKDNCEESQKHPPAR